MPYIVLDLEFTELYPHGIPLAQMNNKKGTNVNKEIIQIGAVKVSDDGQLIDNFKANVYPMYSGSVDKYVEKLTGLTYPYLKSTGTKFGVACRKFRSFIGDPSIPILTWGDSDKFVLQENLRIWRQRPLDNPFVDLQSLAAQKLFPGQARKSVENALEALEIPPLGTSHDAFFDAWNEANIFLCIKDPREAIAHHNPYYFQCGMIHDPDCYSIITENKQTSLKDYLRKDQLVSFAFSQEASLLIPRFEHGSNHLKVWRDQGSYYLETAKFSKNKTTLLAYLRVIEDEELTKIKEWYEKYQNNLKALKYKKLHS